METSSIVLFRVVQIHFQNMKSGGLQEARLHVIQIPLNFPIHFTSMFKTAARWDRPFRQLPSPQFQNQPQRIKFSFCPILQSQWLQSEFLINLNLSLNMTS